MNAQKIALNSIAEWLKSYIYHIMAILYIFKMFIPDYIPITFILQFIIILILFIKRKRIKRAFSYNLPNIIWLFYVVLHLLSFVYLMFGMYKFENYVDGIIYLVVPIFTYLNGVESAKYFPNTDLENNYVKYAYSIFWLTVVGLALHVINPLFYINYFNKTMSNSHGSLVLLSRADRFGGLLIAPQPTSLLCLLGLCITIEAARIIIPTQKAIIMIIVMTLGVFLSFQRAAWAGLAFILIAYFVFTKFKKKAFLIIFTIIIGFIVYYVISKDMIAGFALDDMIYRLQTFDGLLQRRFFEDSRNVEALENFKNRPLGSGMFITGSIDGNYHRILQDFGILGFMPFISLIIISVINAIFKRKIYILAIIGVFCIGSLGSAQFDGINGAIVFWSLLGYVNNLKTLDCNGMTNEFN